jgi:hypothetical protein
MARDEGVGDVFPDLSQTRDDGVLCWSFHFQLAKSVQHVFALICSQIRTRGALHVKRRGAAWKPGWFHFFKNFAEA